MTDAELTRLEALAASATNGPWHVWVKDPDIVCHSHGAEQDPAGRDTYTIADTSGCLDENADYIAAVSPDVVLRLVAEVRRLRVAERFAKASLAVEDRPGLMPRPALFDEYAAACDAYRKVKEETP